MGLSDLLVPPKGHHAAIQIGCLADHRLLLGRSCSDEVAEKKSEPMVLPKRRHGVGCRLQADGEIQTIARRAGSRVAPKGLSLGGIKGTSRHACSCRKAN